MSAACALASIYSVRPARSVRSAPPAPSLIIHRRRAAFAAPTNSGRNPMPTDIVMPQMGESITEGTITKWLKKVGDTVERDEPLFEISTDKVDAEIPSPAAGTLTEIKVPEGATVGINTVVAVIGGGVGKPAAAPAPAVPAPAAPAPAARGPAAPPHRQHQSRRQLQRVSSRRRASAFLAAGAQDRQGQQRRSEPSLRHRPVGTHHQDGHPRLHRESRREACARRRSGQALRRDSRRCSHPRQPGPHDQDAQHHRAAHGGVQAHQPARPHRLQGGHDAHRPAARAREGRSTSSATASS